MIRKEYDGEGNGDPGEIQTGSENETGKRRKDKEGRSTKSHKQRKRR